MDNTIILKLEYFLRSSSTPKNILDIDEIVLRTDLDNKEKQELIENIIKEVYANVKS